ncbi:cysteine-tryptophan domain-containing zinc finger protein 3-like isoform X2 [Benincasa hispida]|uniref:cysteine-tryptophan domain-containing zinc finger protein 3-like isoform X2 n=1 Tax=Benincasa hispida TaxID=102211 RepID=UPI001901561F|nr:cysteine-tryptophan domain-containing zinc finger protein 3-like isoform X2 [Benincasa hispida]
MIIGTRVLGSHLMVGSVEPMMMGDCIDMEEDEASCYHKDNGGDIDPDITLSYIDEKIERFLGHFQKDFEGGVSAEKLGAKYGGYGSFLSAYERPSSILPHNINQQRNCNAAPTPVNVPLEGSSQNPKAPPPKRPETFVCNTISSHNTRGTSGSISGRVDSCLPATKVTNSCPSKGEASGRSSSPMNSGLLKFRIKVGSDSTGLKNAAIYSGLGLDDSPLSSSDNSSDLSEGMLPISQSASDESPSKIIQAMTSFPVPHGALISPLHDSLLGLPRKEKPLPLPKPVLSLEKKKDGLAKLANETTSKQNDSTLVKKKKKEVLHRERQVNHKNEVYASRGEEKTTLTLVNRKLDTEASESKDFLSNELQCKPGSVGLKSSANLDPQKKKLSRKATLHETVKDKTSIKKEKPEIVVEKKLKVVQTASGKIAGSFEEGFKIRSEASRGRKDTDSDTPESENRRNRLKLHSNEKVGANNADSFNSSGLDENRISKDAIERASGDLRKAKGLDNSGIKMSISSRVVEPAGMAPMDEWVCCDICQQWRLLPFGTKPEQLPDKWSCSMLDWLPGMNRCDISEQETTEKLYALYQLPLPESGSALQNHANGLMSADTSNQGKKKETLKEIQNPVSRDGQTHGKSSLNDQQLESRKNRSLNGLSNPPSKMKNSMDQSSIDLSKLAEGKNKVNCDQLKRKNKRPEDMRSVDNHQNFNVDLGKLGCSSNSGLTNMEGGEGMLKQGDIGLKKHNKLNTENRMQISLKKLGGTAEISSVVRSSVNQLSGKSACTKKRKLNDWQDYQNSPNSGLHESVLLKEENCERLKKKKKLDVSSDFTDGTEKISKDKKPKIQNKKVIAIQTSVGKELPKRNLVARQVSGAANSSSSNVSQAHLTKAKFGVKVSPAESVSSSPMRSSGLDQFGGEKEEITSNIHSDSHALNTNSKKIKASPAVQHHFVTADANTVKQPKLCNNCIDDNMEPSQKKRKKEKIHVGAEGLETPQNLKGHDAEDQGSDALFQSNRAVRLQSKRNQDFEAGNEGGLRTVEKRDGKSICSSGGERKEEPSRPGGDPLRVPIRVGDPHQLIANAPSNDVVESKKTPDLQGSRDVNASNLNRMKSSNQTVCDTLKEAKKLRDEADHLKNSGFIFESNELYFQSALKYLHGAYFLETLNNTSGKPGDISPIRFYNITAELCESCAHEYERRQEMAAASLAFKCMEVAYLRIVYHKHPSINGDRLEMHSVFRTIVQGESPSSSASDVDNLSNYGAMDKATFEKGSSHGVRSQIWNAGTCSSFARVLNFAHDMNSAMEASKNSRNAFVAASSCASEGKHVDYVASVKKVIDFSFQDVEELVQLVRVATQTITHSGFCSGRN